MKNKIFAGVKSAIRKKIFWGKNRMQQVRQGEPGGGMESEDNGATSDEEGWEDAGVSLTSYDFS
jgi:hypothetical protein